MGNCRTPVVVLVGCALLSFVVGCSGSDDSGEGATATTTPPSGPTTTAGWSSLVDQLVVNQEQFSEPPAGEPAVNTRRAFGEMDDTSVEAYINAAITHADQQWTGWFTSNGLPEPEVGYKIIMPGEQHQSSCTMNGTNVFASDLPNAFYCRWDRNDFDPDLGMLVFPVQTMANMWTGNIFSQQVSDPSKVGDFAAGAIVAHEFGHHIQDELTENTGAPAPQNPNVELIADCFAGVWAYSVLRDRLPGGR